jgi:hypothetical protein
MNVERRMKSKKEVSSEEAIEEPIQTEYNVEKTVSQRVSKNWWKYELLKKWEQIKS